MQIHPAISKTSKLMDSTFLPKGQRITSPDGSGEVVELIGDKVVVKLDNGSTVTFPSDQVEDDSNAG
ncbi:hypothetical protein M2273_003578 [Mucilaginibacter lappiensis]